MTGEPRKRRGYERREKPAPRPLTAARLDELALSYVARFATSAGKLRDYLRRKLRERGWEGREDGAAEPDVSGIVARFVELGYIDDAVFARAKAGGLLRRGYGERRVEQALGAAGIAEEDRSRASKAEARQAALVMARKRRFGPFGSEPLDRPRREKQLSAMLRAGHPLESARNLVNAASIEAAELWAGECDEG
jgi:regulatory protein